MSNRLGVDVGGTFTDLVLYNEQNGELHLWKTPSTPQDQSIGIIAGISELVAASKIAPTEINTLSHGTTVSTNILLENKGAKVGLLATKDFEQVLHLARSQTPNPLTGWMVMEKPDPLAGLELTRGVIERVSAQGNVITPLDENRARQMIQELIDAGAESITVCLLHSYANPDHERRIRAIIEEVDKDISISLSSDILPEAQEYERTLITVMNAYIGPSMSNYLASFEDNLKAVQISPHIKIARSDGGLMSVQKASSLPVHTIFSGPAGGVSGAAHLAKLAGYENALSFDMGGTSTDVSLIQDGVPFISRQVNLGNYPINMPAVEVNSVGAGGGSIAQVSMMGALRIGPESAGATPGPACYGKGGEEPTITDANLLLGRLPSHLLDGKMDLDLKAAEEAVGKIARKLEVDLYKAAQGMLDIVNENLFGELRLVSVKKGLDPKKIALIAFGGAGPMHGNAMGILADCYPVIVPPTPGVLSALGFLFSDLKNEFTQTYARNIEDANGSQLEEIYGHLGREARDWLSEEGIDKDRQELSYQADVRYFRQGYEFTLQVNPETMRNGGLDDLEARFASAHEKLYGFRLDRPIELVNLRAVGSSQEEIARLPSFELESPNSSHAILEQKQVYFSNGFVNTNVFDRKLLRAGNHLAGPAIVTQADSTTVIHPDHIAIVDQYLNIMISPEGLRG